MTAAEFALWGEYFAKHGFPADRHAWGLAILGEYVGAVWGGKAKAADLLPRFAPVDVQAKRLRIMAYFDAMTNRPDPEANGR